MSAVRLRMRNVKQRNDSDCCPTITMLGLEYLGVSLGYEKICRSLGYQKSSGTWVPAVAKLFAERGFEVQMSLGELSGRGSWDDSSKHELLNSGYPKAYVDLCEICLHAGVRIKAGKPSIRTIQNHLRKKYLIITTVDWFEISDFEEEPQPHCVIISGYDRGRLFLNNTTKEEPKLYYPVSHQLFEVARGEDPEYLVISTP